MGIFLVIAGTLLFLIPYAGLVWGPIAIILGLALIILRNEESKIEPRKDKPI